VGFFDWMTGTKRPADGVVPGARVDVGNALLALNGPRQPFLVRDGLSEGVDLIAEWRIADARWFGYFGRVGTVNRTMMRLVEAKHEVRVIDQEWTVTWVGHEPRLTLARSHSRGQMNKTSVDMTFSRNENGQRVKESSSSFSTSAMKSPMQRVVTGSSQYN
jgi:hypothetical protein